ncbi:MAG: EI24 domain-containing protein [Sulfurospirillum sp.]
MKLFVLSIKDFFTVKMLKYAIMPFVVTLVIMYILFFVAAGSGLDSMHSSLNINTTQITMENGIPHTQNFSAHVENSSIIKFLMQYSVTSWLAAFLVYAIGGFFILYTSIFMAIIIVGFMTPFILKELHTRHYNDIDMIGHSNIFEAVFLVAKWAFVMFLLFFLLIPLYFIPLLNIVAFNLPLYYFFHKILIYDVSSNITTKEENSKIKYFKRGSLRAKTLLLYLISLIPFAIFFGAVFYVIYLGNTYFTEVKKLREESR